MDRTGKRNKDYCRFITKELDQIWDLQDFLLIRNNNLSNNKTADFLHNPESVPANIFKNVP